MKLSPQTTMKIKAILSSILMLSFVIVVATGIGLYFAPSGKIAREISWTFLGFDKTHLENIHTVRGFIMSGTVIIHLFFNFRMFLTELKMLFKRK